jgi:hypothetical protein
MGFQAYGTMMAGTLSCIAACLLGHAIKNGPPPCALMATSQMGPQRETGDFAKLATEKMFV